MIFQHHFDQLIKFLMLLKLMDPLKLLSKICLFLKCKPVNQNQKNTYIYISS